MQAQGNSQVAPGKVVGMLLLVIVATGCSKKDRPKVYPSQVRGVVTLDGKPLNSGTVTFLPKQNEEDGGRVGLAKIEADGSYWLGNSNRSKAPGVPEGTYVVTVLAEELADDGSGIKSKIPAGYQREETTPFKFELEKGDHVIELELESNYSPPTK